MLHRGMFIVGMACFTLAIGFWSLTFFGMNPTGLWFFNTSLLSLSSGLFGAVGLGVSLKLDSFVVKKVRRRMWGAAFFFATMIVVLYFMLPVFIWAYVLGVPFLVYWGVLPLGNSRERRLFVIGLVALVLAATVGFLLGPGIWLKVVNIAISLVLMAPVVLTGTHLLRDLEAAPFKRKMPLPLPVQDR